MRKNICKGWEYLNCNGIILHSFLDPNKHMKQKGTPAKRHEKKGEHLEARALKPLGPQLSSWMTPRSPSATLTLGAAARGEGPLTLEDEGWIKEDPGRGSCYEGKKCVGRVSGEGSRLRKLLDAILREEFVVCTCGSVSVDVVWLLFLYYCSIRTAAFAYLFV